MINIIPIVIDERGSVKKDIAIIAMEGENLSKRFSVLLPNSIKDKWLYIEFEKADGQKFVSERLSASSGYLEYDITNQLTIKGKLICQVIAKDGNNVVWKSNKFDFTIPSSINAMETIPQSSPDILTDLQKQIDNIEVGGGADLTNYYTKAEVDNKISEIPTNETDLTNYYKKEETYSQEEVNNLLSNIPAGGDSAAIQVVEVSGSSVTLEPNKHYVISGVTNSLRISVSEPIDSELKHYSFEFTSVDRIPKVTFTNVTEPYNYEYERYKGYLGEIVNNRVCYKSIYDAYPYQFIYGTYATADWTASYLFKNDQTVVNVSDGGNVKKNGTYSISLDGEIYSIYIEYEDGESEYIAMTDQGTFTVNSVVYTKS